MRVLIAIHGSHSQPECMEAQRNTWLRDLREADYKFFLGRPQASDPDVVYSEFADGPIWQRNVGGPRTAVPNQKTEALVRYALENGYDFVFKCDDDTYVRPGPLFASGFEQHDYTGVTDKHYCRELGFYRWAQGGAGYWLSRRAMRAVLANGLPNLPEDFAVGNALAHQGIHPHHDERYVPGVTTRQLEHLDECVLTLHKVSPEWMQRLHRHFAGDMPVQEEAASSLHELPGNQQDPEQAVVYP